MAVRAGPTAQELDPTPSPTGPISVSSVASMLASPRRRRIDRLERVGGRPRKRTHPQTGSRSAAQPQQRLLGGLDPALPRRDPGTRSLCTPTRMHWERPQRQRRTRRRRQSPAATITGYWSNGKSRVQLPRPRGPPTASAYRTRLTSSSALPRRSQATALAQARESTGVHGSTGRRDPPGTRSSRYSRPSWVGLPVSDVGVHPVGVGLQHGAALTPWRPPTPARPDARHPIVRRYLSVSRPGSPDQLRESGPP